MKKILSALVLCLLICFASACSPSDNGSYEADSSLNSSSSQEENYSRETVNLMKNIARHNVQEQLPSDAFNRQLNGFSLRLFRESFKEGENILLSPLSVISVLGMTANGACGETLRGIEKAAGIKSEDLNRYMQNLLHNYNAENNGINLANSVWFDRSVNVNSGFLQTNADYYGADIFKSSFSESTLKDINSWVSRKTGKMIPKLLDSLNKDAVMYIINALSFEAQWEEPYERDSQIQKGNFINSDGKAEEAEFMYSREKMYLENECASGFIKYYKNYDYAFAALLPDEDSSVSECLDMLNGDKLTDLLSEPQAVKVNAYIPQFRTEYSADMKDVLKTMGMQNAFRPLEADFTGISDDGGIFINKFIHKTLIEVGEKGTKAGAATAAEIEKISAMPEKEIKTVRLDRPFIYMIIDCSTQIPVFAGVLSHIK